MTTTSAAQALQLARTLLRQPGNEQALLHLAGIVRQSGSPADAAQLLQQIAARRPADAEPYRQLGLVLLQAGRHAEAEAALRRARSLQPDMPGLDNNLAAALHAQGRSAAAAELLAQRLQLTPGDAGMYRNLALFLQSQEKHAEAEPALRQALALAPGDRTTTCNLAIALLNQGRHDEARALLAPLLATEPPGPSSLLYALTFDPDLPPETFLAEARRLGAQLAATARPFTHWQTDADGTDLACLRVGLVSADLRLHPVSFFLESFIAALDPQRVQLVAYSCDPRSDAMTARLRRHFALWRDINALGDEAAARQIHADGIHVLVDLAGHSSRNRLAVFAWKPAPVQASWLGFSTTTGVDAIDWLLVDPVSVPAPERGLYSERPWYFPEGRLCFTPPAEAAELPPPAARRRRGNDDIVFGSFQGMAKINDRVLATWARILAALPAATLRVQNAAMDVEANRESLLRRLAALGVGPDRVRLAGAMPRGQYLAAHAEVDLLLDTFPYVGGTTTCEALWMGVPTLTLAGRTLLSRYGASLLAGLGLDDWIAGDEDEYVQRAIAHASGPEALDRLRVELRERMRLSPLGDSAGFARRFADAMHGMWRARRDSNP